MKVYKENYGADIDGNRGRIVTEHEVDDDDFDNIYNQIQAMVEDLEETETLPECVEITLICPISDEDIQFEVYVKDYL